ncbi:YciI family protein [Aquiflexum gelatinilyticum]|uniref:YciI family protein n=1 Tax=Aquiflexum gelatinilyticum TaxID=2961943 RepID=A0A9X2P2T1_9BACT|nr:YciI family protein [Aquiflexum gelatinilyticum]MCR9013927.1 YciI family protein [Aquiflexum gelatinilyticum]MCS4433376.1 YciI family protein [Aquiflexum gelatinilyticum]
MKKYCFFLFILFFSVLYTELKAQTGNYDAQLAEKLKADDLGMKKYVMAFLYSGDRVSEYSKEERAEIQKGHMANITKLADMGKLILAGPFFGTDAMRGIFIFDVTSIEEAESLTNTDPAIKAGVLKMELKEWYGSAALVIIPEIHQKIQKTGFD